MALKTTRTSAAQSAPQVGRSGTPDEPTRAHRTLLPERHGSGEMMTEHSEPILVGDVGGTHVRLGLSGAGGLDHLLDLTGEFDDFGQALEEYRERSALPRLPGRAIFAVAGPVIAGGVKLTNRNWALREEELRRFGFSRVSLINDFAALAWAAPILGPADLRFIGPALTGEVAGTISIIGAGTGFGVACLARNRDCAIALSTEGGHMGFAPTDGREIEILRILQQRLGRVSLERILSGPGLENLHTALEQMAGHAPRAVTAPQIVEASASGDLYCQEALALFCSIYGAVAGDIALAHGATGGVLVAGGIGQKIGEFLSTSAFRAKFEDKGRLMPYMKLIPTRLICNPNAALLGAARAGRLTGAAHGEHTRREPQSLALT